MGYIVELSHDVDIVELSHDELKEFCSECNMNVMERIRFITAIRKYQASQRPLTGMMNPKIITIPKGAMAKINQIEIQLPRINEIIQNNKKRKQNFLSKSEQTLKTFNKTITEIVETLHQQQQTLIAKLHQEKQQLIGQFNSAEQKLHHQQYAMQQIKHQIQRLQNDTSQEPFDARLSQITNKIDDINKSMSTENLLIKIPDIKITTNMNEIKTCISSMKLDFDYSTEDQNDYKSANISDITKKVMIRFSNKDNTESILLEKCEVSNRSDLFDGDAMMGIVIYQYDGKSEWQLNGINCTSGFIYLCKSDKLNNINSYPINTMHAC
eukprot:53300_1